MNAPATFALSPAGFVVGVALALAPLAILLVVAFFCPFDPLPPPETPMKPTARKASSLFTALLSLSLALTPGCGPLPGPGGVSSVTGVMATVSTVVDLLGVLVPFLRPLLERRIPDGEAKRVVLVSLQVFESTARAFQLGMVTYDVRGGDRCRAYALSGALTEAGRTLVRDLGRAGVGWGPDLEALMDSLGRLLDRLGGACEALDGGLMMVRGRACVAIREHFVSVEDEARMRGVHLDC